MQLTTPDQSYDFVGFDYKNTVAYFAEVTDAPSDTPIPRILPITIDSKKPSGFKRTLTGLTASLNISYVDQHPSNAPYVKKTPPLFATQIFVRITSEVVLGTFPDPSGEDFISTKTVKILGINACIKPSKEHISGIRTHIKASIH